MITLMLLLVARGGVVPRVAGAMGIRATRIVEPRASNER